MSISRPNRIKILLLGPHGSGKTTTYKNYTVSSVSDTKFPDYSVTLRNDSNARRTSIDTTETMDDGKTLIGHESSSSIYMVDTTANCIETDEKITVGRVEEMPDPDVILIHLNYPQLIEVVTNANKENEDKKNSNNLYQPASLKQYQKNRASDDLYIDNATDALQPFFRNNPYLAYANRHYPSASIIFVGTNKPTLDEQNNETLKAIKVVDTFFDREAYDSNQPRLYYVVIKNQDGAGFRELEDKVNKVFPASLEQKEENTRCALMGLLANYIEEREKESHYSWAFKIGHRKFALPFFRGAFTKEEKIQAATDIIDRLRKPATIDLNDISPATKQGRLGEIYKMYADYINTYQDQIAQLSVTSVLSKKDNRS